MLALKVTSLCVAMAYDSIMEELTLGALLEALSLPPVMIMMLHLMNMVRKKN